MNIIEVIARGVLIKEGALLVSRGVGKNYVCLPGGHVEFFETIEAALHREWVEELGCDCSLQAFLGYFEERFVDDNQEKHHEYTFLYQVDCNSINKDEKPLPQLEPHILFQWLPLNQLHASLLLPKSIREFLCKSLTIKK